MLPLAHAPAWIVASLLLVVGVIYGSLVPVAGVPVAGHLDKLQHFLVYAALAAWFVGIATRANYRWVALGLAALGILLEFLQHSMGAGRVGDPWDVVANVAGLATGLAIAARRGGGWATRVEAWLARN